jgi:1-acyl-sn-glycerol-3-phosphate acyltransferase
MTKALLQGKNLVVFPEGGFSPDPALKPLHQGAFVAAATANVPIVVAELQGAREALPPRAWLPRRVGMRLHIGPIFATGGTSQAAVMQLREAARAAMTHIPVEMSSNSREN